MKVVILQSNYIPWKGYFDLIDSADVFCFYDEVQYTKNDWRNRNKIVGPNGSFWLTIPIDKKAVKLKISAVEFNNYDWAKQHIFSIKQNYAKSPNKTSILKLLTPIYENANNLTLSQFTQRLIIEISRYIGIDTKFINSSDYILEGDRISRLVNLVGDIGGTTYISGPAAKDYLSESENSFEDKGIELSYMQYGPYKKYPQRLDLFEDYISIIDVLMNVDKNELLNYIRSNK